PSPSFSIGVSPLNQSNGAGQSATLNLSVNAMNGFNQGIEVSVTGLPSGVTLSPAARLSMTTGGQSVTLTASSTAALSASTATFKGSSGGLNSSSHAKITVTQA